MASYTLVKNQSLVVNLPNDFPDQGWTVSQDTAYHSGCNPGYIKKIFDLSSQLNWTFRYEIPSIASGTVNIVVGGVSGIVRSSAGIYEETFAISNPNTLIQFYATGISAVKTIQIYPATLQNNGLTLAFNEDADKWVTYLSYVPEFMTKFINSHFTFKGATLWEHNVNERRNSFYGVDYPSIITFYCNLNPTQVKLFHSLREKSNKPWAVTEAIIYPYYGKPNGQLSRIKKGNFKSLQGDWFSDFLRDMKDSRFTSTLDALMNGAQLQGSVMKITIQNDDIVEVRLFSIDILVSDSQYTY